MSALINSSKTNHDNAKVKALFNAKARTWNRKYEADGVLAFRAVAFSRLLRSHLFSNAKVLDLGCGTGAIASALSANGFRVAACDIAEEMVETGKRTYGASKIEWYLLQSNWQRLPFADCSFDAIIASSVLEYLCDVDGVLMECWRVLRPCGILIATVPDPQTMCRKLERVFLPLLEMLHRFPGRSTGYSALSRWAKQATSAIHTLHSYVTYLQCSRQRLSIDEWCSRGKQAGFGRVTQIEIADWKTPLAFLTFCKADSEGNMTALRVSGDTKREA